MDDPTKRDNVRTVFSRIGCNRSHYTTDDSSESYTSPEGLSSSQAHTTGETSSTTDDVYKTSLHHNRREESVVSSGSDRMQFTGIGLSDKPSSTDSVTDIEVERVCHSCKGPGSNPFTHFASEWSSLLDKIEDSVEKVSKNYEGFRPETIENVPRSYEGWRAGSVEIMPRSSEGWKAGSVEITPRSSEGWRHASVKSLPRSYEGWRAGPVENVPRNYEGQRPGSVENVPRSYEGRRPVLVQNVPRSYEVRRAGPIENAPRSYEGWRPGATERVSRNYDGWRPETVQRVSRNYGGWKSETVGQQNVNTYWTYQTNARSTAGTSKSSVSFMSEEQADKWASAPEFHPAFTSRTGRVKTYAEAVNPYAPRTRTKLDTGVQFCPYLHVNRDEIYLCPYLHGELCQICFNALLDFDDTEEKRQHIKECLREQEQRMKVSLAIQKSKGVTCNICLEPVKEKTSGEARFGLLPNCNHCFCITCIRKWRQETRFKSQITRSCPICRVESPFVCPSSFWVESPEEKDAVITNYKKALRVKPCRLYNFGKGKCPFGDKCFYLHALADGRKPERLDSRKPKRLNAEGLAHTQDYVLWDFIAMRDDPENYQQSVRAQYPRSLDSSSTESETY